MTRIRSALLAAALLAAPLARAQQQPANPDPFNGALFNPELVMQHQDDIGLTDAQRTQITAEITKAQQKATEVTWKLQKEMVQLNVLLKQAPIDEQAVIAQLDRVLALERDVKRAQVTLLVRMKNILTPEQQIKLRDLRDGKN